MNSGVALITDTADGWVHEGVTGKGKRDGRGGDEMK